MKNIFYIVDVFALEKYTGNQLAVVRMQEKLSGEQMLKIANDMHFSETTFITSEEVDEGGYDVRIFTPVREVPFAGHPTLGTAYVIQKEIVKQEVRKVFLNLQVGQIPVDFIYKNGMIEMLEMKQKNPKFGRNVGIDEIAPVLGLSRAEINTNFPVQEVSTGIWFLIVPVNSLDALKKCKVNLGRYYALINGLNAKGIIVFSTETHKKENDLSVRVFVDYYGVPEDPATGSANGCLAGYLVQNRFYERDRISLSVEQGYELNRPSSILIRAERGAGTIDVYVGGQVIMIARGELI